MSENRESDVIYMFGTTPCRHEKYGNGKIVSSVECYGNVSTMLCTIKFDNIEELISVYDDEIEILNDT